MVKHIFIQTFHIHTSSVMISFKLHYVMQLTMQAEVFVLNMNELNTMQKTCTYFIQKKGHKLHFP